MTPEETQQWLESKIETHVTELFGSHVELMEQRYVEIMQFLVTSQITEAFKAKMDGMWKQIIENEFAALFPHEWQEIVTMRTRTKYTLEEIQATIAAEEEIRAHYPSTDNDSDSVIIDDGQTGEDVSWEPNTQVIQAGTSGMSAPTVPSPPKPSTTVIKKSPVAINAESAESHAQ